MRACLRAGTVKLCECAVYDKMRGEVQSQLCIEAGMSLVSCHTHTRPDLLVTQKLFYVARAEEVPNVRSNEIFGMKRGSKDWCLSLPSNVSVRECCTSQCAGQAVSNGCCIIAEYAPRSSLKPTVTALLTAPLTAPSFDYTATPTPERRHG